MITAWSIDRDPAPQDDRELLASGRCHLDHGQTLRTLSMLGETLPGQRNDGDAAPLLPKEPDGMKRRDRPVELSTALEAPNGITTEPPERAR